MLFATPGYAVPNPVDPVVDLDVFDDLEGPPNVAIVMLYLPVSIVLLRILLLAYKERYRVSKE